MRYLTSAHRTTVDDMRRLTAVLTLTLTLGLFTTGCASAPTGTDALAIEPADPDLFVSIVQSHQEVEGEEEAWGELWRQLRWAPGEPTLSDKVGMWGVLVVDEERKESFVLGVDEFAKGGPAETFEEVPENLFKKVPDHFTPGDSYILGSELTEGEGLPPVARFFQGTLPGVIGSGQFDWTGHNFRVNGVLDGIFAPGEKARTQLLLMPLVADRPRPDNSERTSTADITRGPRVTAGILIQYEEAE